MDIKTLEDKILQAQNAYYNTGNSIMSDAEFDELWNELSEKDPNNKIFTKVGQDSGSGFVKVKHLMVCGSQNKCNEVEEFREWYYKYGVGEDLLVEYKCDGSSVELQYENGKFIRAVSRGNGEIGDDVTDNISKAQFVVKDLLDREFTGAVRGEVLLFHDTFEKYCKDSANCRNAANGIMKRKNSEKANLLSVVVYDVLNLHDPDYFEKEIDKINWLKSQKFKTVECFYMHGSHTLEEIISLRDRLSTERFRTIEYDIDGLVIKTMEVDNDDLRKTRPDKQIAFKFILSEQPTTVRKVEWYANGKTRTPVAVCDPVYLCGTTVQKANLCNLQIIKALGVKIGSKVMMVKRGEIIPKIDRVLETPVDAMEIIPPDHCEFCGSKLIIKPTTIYCPNRSCVNTLVHRIVKWVTVNKIYGLGPALAEALVREGIVTDVKDLYSTKIEDMSKVMSPKIARKIIENINKTREMSLAKFIGGYDLDGIGEVMIEKIIEAKHIENLNQLLRLSPHDIQQVPGFAGLSSENICEELKMYGEELTELSKYVNIKPENVIPDNLQATGVTGNTFVFTGPLMTMTRDVAKELVKQSGGIAVNSVTRNTDYLVTNEESGSSKYLAAKKLGVKIINEEQFLNLLNTKI